MLLMANELHLHIPYFGMALLGVLVIGLLGIVAAAIVQFTKGQTRRGVMSLIAFPVMGITVLRGVFYLVTMALFNEEPDNFGKNIIIPANMQISDPLQKFDEAGEQASDAFTTIITAAFATDNASATASTDLGVLNEFGTINRSKLIHHLSASPRWFVTKENGKPYAYRRFVVDGEWKNTLNGFYTSSELSGFSGTRFQTRIVIGFDGPVFAGVFRKKVTEAKVGTNAVEVRVIEDKQMNQGLESYFVLRGSPAAIEVFEQSSMNGRPATQLALAEIKRELEDALTVPQKETTNTENGILTREADIQIANGIQGGIYQVRAHVNPGETGHVYLKVFEATQNIPLSTERLRQRSTARIGWSNNSQEKFLYQSEVTVYEGDWGNFYPARFELWLTPDSGAKERKLIERIFRIEGWMR